MKQQNNKTPDVLREVDECLSKERKRIKTGRETPKTSDWKRKVWGDEERKKNGWLRKMTNIWSK